MNSPAQSRRAAILRAAARVFTSYGARKTTVADIAREASVGVGTVYLEFRNKNMLLRALSRDRFEGVLARMEEALNGEGTAPERLRAALTVRAMSFVDGADGRHGADLYACTSRAISAERQAFRDAERVLLAAFLRQAREAKELSAEDPDLCARAVLQAYAAFEPPGVFAHGEHLEEELAMMHRLVLNGLLPR